MAFNKISFMAIVRLSMAVLAVVAQSCMKENRENCPEPSTRTLTVKAYDNSGAELTRDEVSSMIIYFFDSSLRFEASVATNIGETISLEDFSNDDLHVVALGNIDKMTTYSGEHRDEFGVRLSTFTRSDSFSYGADDVFHGTIVLPGDRQEPAEMPVYRKMASITATIRNLKDFAGFADDDYSIVVGETFSSMTFDGTLSGNRVSYLTRSSFRVNNGGEELYMDQFPLIPEEEGVYLDIYHGGEFVIRVDRSAENEPIVVRQGELTNVLVDLAEGDTNVDVKVVMSGWGKEQLWKEF